MNWNNFAYFQTRCKECFWDRWQRSAESCLHLQDRGREKWMDVSVNDDLHEKVLVSRTPDHEMKWKKPLYIIAYHNPMRHAHGVLESNVAISIGNVINHWFMIISVYHWVVMYLESLESTQEVRVGLGSILRNSYTSLFYALQISFKLYEMLQRLN